MLRDNMPSGNLQQIEPSVMRITFRGARLVGPADVRVKRLLNGSPVETTTCQVLGCRVPRRKMPNCQVRVHGSDAIR